ncbi:quinolinate synthase NadA [Fusobacterium simiae]|uniref:quinolinate synthase NadA n=1 Tax=Fusobacterium TaxID=848 RepID=UPI0003F55024|nr:MULTISPECIES: quinolinate synthase NadA [Fusobacterium]MDC7955135.1 quinolinate synthase NadA [Fusobacterium simiae]
MKNRIKKLQKEKDVAILAHYYVDGEVQEIADYVGDSFYLAKTATKLNNKIIIMAGVYFMGESIKILNPKKTVQMVDIYADCPMAHMITVEKIKEMRKKYNDLAVVCYINSTAEIKAYCDICITSSNAVEIVNKLKEKNIFIVPDGNLASYIKKQVKSKNIILNEGYCCVHNLVHLENVIKLKNQYPNAKVLVHPECKEEILNLADYVGSTSGIIAEVLKDGDEFIIITERGIRYKIYEKAPNKKLYFADALICKSMKKNTLEKIEKILLEGGNELKVDDEIAKKALVPLKRMLELTGD